jgi:hypothetical protein
VTNRPGNFLIPIAHIRLKDVDKSVLEENLELEHKKYLRYAYELASVDNYDTKAYIRYNIFYDEFEFVKDESIYYLAKEAGRKIHFVISDETYKAYELNGDINFFKVHTEGKTTLLAKHAIKYVNAKVAKSGYDKARKADYKRKKDELYITFNTKDLVKIPSKKKEFYAIFGDKSLEIKKFMKENKLGRKKINDLKKIVDYHSTL